MEVIAALIEHPLLDGNLAVQCALLHDTIEDTTVSKEQLAAHFSQRMAEGVEALTKNANLPKDKQMKDSLERIKQQPDEVWLVKLADRIVNLAPPPSHWDEAKITAYQLEAKVIHAELHKASNYLGNRLLTRIDAYAQNDEKHSLNFIAND